jgi:hypothetical protein
MVFDKQKRNLLGPYQPQWFINKTSIVILIRKELNRKIDSNNIVRRAERYFREYSQIF